MEFVSIKSARMWESTAKNTKNVRTTATETDFATATEIVIAIGALRHQRACILDQEDRLRADLHTNQVNLLVFKLLLK